MVSCRFSLKPIHSEWGENDTGISGLVMQYLLKLPSQWEIHHAWGIHRGHAKYFEGPFANLSYRTYGFEPSNIWGYNG